MYSVSFGTRPLSNHQMARKVWLRKGTTTSYDTNQLMKHLKRNLEMIFIYIKKILWHNRLTLNNGFLSADRSAHSQRLLWPHHDLFPLRPLNNTLLFFPLHSWQQATWSGTRLTRRWLVLSFYWIISLAGNSKKSKFSSSGGWTVYFPSHLLTAR